MFNPSIELENEIRTIISKAIESAEAKGLLKRNSELPEFAVEIPKDSANGDLAVNVALVTARVFSKSPKVIADIIAKEVNLSESYFCKIESAGPGFLNFFLNQKFFTSVLSGILNNGAEYGRSDFGKGKKYMVEFVSANPTGPMHLGNAHGGAVGDCLASVLDAAGYEVSREFYVNDSGNQIIKFSESLDARYLQLFCDDVVFPEDGYKGDDIIERAAEFAEIHGDSYINFPPETRKEALVEFALAKNISNLKSDLEKYRIIYDRWFLESSLYQDGTLEKVMNILNENGCLYEKDGATWYRATDFGCEKDEVVIRANNIPTYFAVDIAYHYNKFVVRGFDVVINVWGADHHGHVSRLKGAMDAIGVGGDRLQILLTQLVRLVRDGEPVRMSKRTGKAITLATLLEEIPVDAARFFFNLRDPRSQFEFDLDLAAKQNSDNPVYYVQYAHARICSILKSFSLGEDELKNIVLQHDLSVLDDPTEKELIKYMSRLPMEIVTAASGQSPSGLTKYVIELSTLFHRFYTNCRVKGEPEEIMYPRLAVCLATRQVLRNCLDLLKISAPESM
ncbi:MAG: arginine--tRNA ligase [Ruminococcaceae bacterium]|mgnify:CR=1 FL=1|nr:arginine--tRNA ligase [Oscillospiraceae bacterium]